MSLYWTAARHEQAVQTYLAAARMAPREAWVHAAKSLGLSKNKLRKHLTESADWPFVQSQARGMDAPAAAQPIERVDPTNAEINRLEAKLVVAQDKVRDLTQKLQVGARTQSIITTLAERLEQVVTPIHYADVASPKHGVWAKPDVYVPDGREEVDAVVMMTDQHADRVVSSEGTWGIEHYNFDIFRARLYEWAKVTKAYTTKHLPNYRFHTLWCWHLGDAVNGDIHNMKHRNDWGNTLQAAIETGNAQAQALAYLADSFERIVVVCVSGNHGRTTAQMELEDPWDNFDYLVARTMQLRFAGTPLESKVIIEIPRAWTAYVEVRGHLWSLNHGNNVKGTWGIPWYGFERREGRIQRLASQLGRSVDYYAYGHYHTPMTRPAGNGRAIHGGAWYMTDPFALNALSAGNAPEQQLIVFSERFGRQIEIPIQLRDTEREAALLRGEWEPPFGRSIQSVTAEPAVGTLPIITGVAP